MVVLLACLQEHQNEFIPIISLNAKKSWGFTRQPEYCSIYLCFLEASEAMRQSIIRILSADRRVWGKTGFRQVSSPSFSLLLASHTRPMQAQVWKADKNSIMWLGAVDTESMQKQSESLVGDSQSHSAAPLPNKPREPPHWVLSLRSCAERSDSGTSQAERKHLLLWKDAVMLIRCDSNHMCK